MYVYLFVYMYMYVYVCASRISRYEIECKALKQEVERKAKAGDKAGSFECRIRLSAQPRTASRSLGLSVHYISERMHEYTHAVRCDERARISGTSRERNRAPEEAAASTAEEDDGRGACRGDHALRVL